MPFLKQSYQVSTLLSENLPPSWYCRTFPVNSCGTHCSKLTTELHVPPPWHGAYPTPPQTFPLTPWPLTLWPICSLVPLLASPSCFPMSSGIYVTMQSGSYNLQPQPFNLKIIKDKEHTKKWRDQLSWSRINRKCLCISRPFNLCLGLDKKEKREISGLYLVWIASWEVSSP